jgi:hypothetical protein
VQLDFTLIALLLLSGCKKPQGPPDLYDPAELSRSFEDRVRLQTAAPIIVVGVVETFRVAGKPVPSQRDKRINLDLTEVTIQVEQTIMGSISSKHLNFWYYNYSSHNEQDLGRRRYLPNPGQRRIFFLSPSPPGYRSIGDVVDYTFPLRSGHHSKDFCAHETVGCCIAELMLVPRFELRATDF